MKYLFIISIVLVCVIGGASRSLLGMDGGKNMQTIMLESIEIHSRQPPCIPHPHIEFFMYHYIRDKDSRDTPITARLSVSPALFESHMQTIAALREQGKVTLMHGEDFVRAFDSSCFPSDNIWVFTADDGWSDTYDTLFPIAKKYNIPFFVGIIGGKIGIPGFVTEEQIRTMSEDPLFTISSHSMNHGDQSKMTQEDELHEICGSKSIIEKITGKEVSTYIYPSGKINPSTSDDSLKECGYTLAWSTQYGTDWNTHPNRYEINRVRITLDTLPSFFRHLAGSDMVQKSGEVTQIDSAHQQ